MTLVFDAPVPIEDAITFVQEQPIPKNNALTQLFPRREYDTDEVDFSTLNKTHRILQYRSWDGSFAPVPRDTASEKRVKLPPLGGYQEKGEYERRQEEFARTGGTNTAALVRAIYDDLANMTEYAFNRIELAWGDALSDGKFTINENGINLETDFGLAAAHNVTAATLWSTPATADVLADLLAWNDVYTATNGVGPGGYLTSLEVLRLLMTNTKLINAIKGNQTGATHVSITEINALLASFGLPGFEMPPAGTNVGGSVYNSNLDVLGTTTRVFPKNKLLFLPNDKGALGFTAWGLPTTSMELNSKNVQTTIAPGLVGIIVREANPPYRKHTYVDGVGMPIIADPRLLFVATVTT